MYYRLPKDIEALHNTTFHLYKCAKLDRPDPFIYQEAHKRVGYALVLCFKGHLGTQGN